MATEVAVAMIMTVPTWPVIDPSIVRAVDWSVVAVPIIWIAVVVTVVVINAAQYQGRGDTSANTPPPSMPMRFRTISGADHDHQSERRRGDECC
jgi:hypothetical protein